MNLNKYSIPARRASEIARLNDFSRPFGVEIIGIKETLFRGDDMDGVRHTETHFIRRPDGVYSTNIWADLSNGNRTVRVDSPVKVE